jgi:hypothetical protein
MRGNQLRWTARQPATTDLYVHLVTQRKRVVWQSDLQPVLGSKTPRRGKQQDEEQQRDVPKVHARTVPDAPPFG